MNSVISNDPPLGVCAAERAHSFKQTQLFRKRRFASEIRSIWALSLDAFAGIKARSVCHQESARSAAQIPSGVSWTFTMGLGALDG